jgi:hypothetical protein
LRDDLIQDIPLVILLSRIRCIDKIRGSPVEVPNSVGRRAYKASGMKTDIVITAIASWLAASNKPVIVHEWHAFYVKVLQQIQFCVDSGPEVFVLELGLETVLNMELGVHGCESLLIPYGFFRTCWEHSLYDSAQRR